MDPNFIIFSNKMGDIYYFSEEKILATVYNGLVEYDLFAEIIKVVNDTAMNNGIHGALADVSKLRGSFHRLLQYMEEIGFPHLVDFGLSVQAQIISDDLMMINLVSKVNEILASLGVNYKTFEDRDEGYNWLLSQL